MFWQTYFLQKWKWKQKNQRIYGTLNVINLILSPFVFNNLNLLEELMVLLWHTWWYPRVTVSVIGHTIISAINQSINQLITYISLRGNSFYPISIGLSKLKDIQSSNSLPRVCNTGYITTGAMTGQYIPYTYIIHMYILHMNFLGISPLLIAY